MNASPVLVVFIRVWRLVMLTQAKYEQEERKPSCRRGHSFHLYLVYLCPPKAATTDTMYWETGKVKIWKIIIKKYWPFTCCSVATALLYPSQSASHGMRTRSKICPGECVICHTCPADDLEKSLNMNGCYEALLIHTLHAYATVFTLGF